MMMWWILTWFYVSQASSHDKLLDQLFDYATNDNLDELKSILDNYVGSINSIIDDVRL